MTNLLLIYQQDARTAYAGI